MIDPITGEIAEAPERTIRPFSEFLNEHREGDLHHEISASLNQLVEAVQGVGRPGSLTVTFTVKPAGRSHEQVFVADDVKLKLPAPDREEKILFIDKDFNLSRDNPYQQALPGLRDVTRPSAAEAREVAN